MVCERLGVTASQSLSCRCLQALPGTASLVRRKLGVHLVYMVFNIANFWPWFRCLCLDCSIPLLGFPSRCGPATRYVGEKGGKVNERKKGSKGSRSIQPGLS